MKTVGYYKRAGLEFICGDKVDDSADNIGIDIIPLSEDMAERCNEGKHGFYLAPVGEFAWRTNTGEKPSFSGLIEWDGLTGARYINRVDELIWDNDIVKWRPSLNQSTTQTETPQEKEAFEAMTESKPVFTQAMADKEMVDLIAENSKLKSVIKILIGD